MSLTPTYLEDFRRTEAAHPEEASLSRRCPQASHQVEHIGSCKHSPQVEQLIIVPHALFNNGPQVRINNLRLQHGLELRHVLAVIF